MVPKAKRRKIVCDTCKRVFDSDYRKPHDLKHHGGKLQRIHGAGDPANPFEVVKSKRSFDVASSSSSAPAADDHVDFASSSSTLPSADDHIDFVSSSSTLPSADDHIDFVSSSSTLPSADDHIDFASSSSPIIHAIQSLTKIILPSRQ